MQYSSLPGPHPCLFPLKNAALYMGKRGRGRLIFPASFLLIMAGSRIKCSFVSREAITKRLVWSFRVLVMTEENEKGFLCLLLLYLIRHYKASYLVVKRITGMSAF